MESGLVVALQEVSAHFLAEIFAGEAAAAVLAGPASFSPRALLASAVVMKPCSSMRSMA